MSVLNEFQVEEGVYRIEDANTLINYLFMAGGGVLAFFGLSVMFRETFLGGLAVIAFAGFFIWAVKQQMETSKLGFTVDTVNNSLSVPLSLLSTYNPEDWTETFSLDFLMNAIGLRQTIIPLDSIQTVRSRNPSSVEKSALTENYELKTRHYIDIDFAGGSFVLRLNRRKRDALYSILVEVLDMEST